MPPEDDRATATGKMHKKFGTIRRVVPESEDMIADKHTHTHTHKRAHHNTPLPYQGKSNKY